MYESPITMVQRTISEQMRQEEDRYICEIEQEVGFHIDKQELIRALNYERQQYEKGYLDGRVSGKHEIESKLVHLSSNHYIGPEYLNRLEAQDADSDYKEFIKKRLCNDIGQYLYDNNLVSFTESESFDGGTIIRADVQVYDENKE